MPNTTIREGTLVQLGTEAKRDDPPAQPSPPSPSVKEDHTDTALDRVIKLCAITWCSCEIIGKAWNLADRFM